MKNWGCNYVFCCKCLRYDRSNLEVEEGMYIEKKKLAEATQNISTEGITKHTQHYNDIVDLPHVTILMKPENMRESDSLHQMRAMGGLLHDTFRNSR